MKNISVAYYLSNLQSYLCQMCTIELYGQSSMYQCQILDWVALKKWKIV